MYANANCSGSPVATGSAAELESPGIPVEVAEGLTGVFSATATDTSDNASDCSEPISYTHLKATTEPGGGGGSTGGDGSTSGSGGNGGSSNQGGGGPTSTPACVVPKLAGKTLARAKAALRAASCKLGTVRKPRSHKGVRPTALVIRSSTPAAGTKPASGKVNLVLGPKPSKR